MYTACRGLLRKVRIGQNPSQPAEAVVTENMAGPAASRSSSVIAGNARRTRLSIAPAGTRSAQPCLMMTTAVCKSAWVMSVGQRHCGMKVSGHLVASDAGERIMLRPADNETGVAVAALPANEPL